MQELPYTVFSLGHAKLHQIHTDNLVPPFAPAGKLFIMSEVAAQLFQESPGPFAKELRAGRHPKAFSRHPAVLRAVNSLIERRGLPPEGSGDGVTLLPASTVEALLQDRRRADLVQPLRLALLKLSSQEAARLMAQGAYEESLPVALDAVQQGQALFRPGPALQLFPLYLLAAQANLGLRRAAACEEFLSLAGWLALKEPRASTPVMRSQLARLHGQLHALQGKHDEALRAFAEDVYYCALEYGPEDVRTSLGYYNLSKVFQSQGRNSESLACSDHVVSVWSGALKHLVLGEEGGKEQADGEKPPPDDLPLGRAQLLEVVDMLQDICALRAQHLGATSGAAGDAHLAVALAFARVEDVSRAREHLARASNAFQACGLTGQLASTQKALEKCDMIEAAGAPMMA